MKRGVLHFLLGLGLVPVQDLIDAQGEARKAHAIAADQARSAVGWQGRALNDEKALKQIATRIPPSPDREPLAYRQWEIAKARLDAAVRP